jgi:hypothetical protein
MRTFFFGDWATKAVALFMAVLLWTYLFWQRHDEIVKGFPLGVQYPHGSVARIEVFDSDGRRLEGTVTLKLAATQGLAEDLERLQVRCQVALPESAFREPVQGTHSVTLGPSHLLGLPGRTSFEFLPSPEITIRYWKFRTVTVPVTLGDVVEPPEGYERVGEARFEPPLVRLRLPADAEPPGSLRLATINLDKRTAACQLDVRPQTPPGMELLDETVQVEFDIRPRPQTKELRVKIDLVWAREPAMYAWSLNREDVRVKATGLKEDVERLSAENCVLRVCVGADDIPKPEAFVNAESDIRILKDVQLITKVMDLRGPLKVEPVDELRITFTRKP